ncbi:MAG TPA: trehalose-phosphatase [Thermoanaerobaculia bacterium]|nr:trehalose-phosphatase [Thermoanaerobaculia bacterium]
MTRLLLASDFDGTLAPLQTDPTRVTIDPQAYALLKEAAETRAVEVAVISGRDLGDLRERTAGLRCWLSGSHGHEIMSPAGELIQEGVAWSGSLDPDWEARARAAGLRLEPKRFGVGLHWRDVPGIDEAHPLIGEFESWAGGHGLSLVRGRCVVEAAIGGASKETVLKILLERTGAPRLLYAGDDLTDFPALEFAASQGRGWLISSAERPEESPPGVERVKSREELLKRFREELDAIRV